MSDLEKGFVHFDDNNNATFYSYNSMGGGLFIIILLILSTVIFTDIGDFIIKNKWVVIFPTIIGVIIRTKIFDGDLPIVKRLLNIIFDVIKTICMYGVVLVVIDNIVNAHWLDRILLVVFYGVVLFVVYYLLRKWLLDMTRICKLCALHIVVCLILSTICVKIYFNHTWYWMGYDYTIFLDSASIVKVDPRIEGEIEIPEKINNYTVRSISKYAFLDNKKVISLKLPQTIEIIKEDALSGGNIKTLTIPTSVKMIEKDAFWNTDELTQIFYMGTEEQWKNINIKDNYIYENKIIYYSR